MREARKRKNKEEEERERGYYGFYSSSEYAPEVEEAMRDWDRIKSFILDLTEYGDDEARERARDILRRIKREVDLLLAS